MKSKLFILGIIFSFLLIGCLGAFMVTWATGRFFFEPAEEKPRNLIQINPVAPLNTPVTYVKQEPASSPPGLIQAALRDTSPNDPPATATLIPLPPAPTATPSPAPSPTPVTALAPSPTVSPVPVPAQPGVATRLVIPKLELDRPILFSPVKNGTWQVNHLKQEIGHLEGTAAPGASDNIVLAGHVTLVSGELGPFAQLDKLAPGDLITVYEGDREYFYLVESRQTVKPSDISVVYPTNTGQLTLITCANWSSQQGRYVERLVVKGRLLRG